MRHRPLSQRPHSRRHSSLAFCPAAPVAAGHGSPSQKEEVVGALGGTRWPACGADRGLLAARPSSPARLSSPARPSSPARRIRPIRTLLELEPTGTDPDPAGSKTRRRFFKLAEEEGDKTSSAPPASASAIYPTPSSRTSSRSSPPRKPAPSPASSPLTAAQVS